MTLLWISHHEKENLLLDFYCIQGKINFGDFPPRVNIGVFEELGWKFQQGKHNVINSNKTYFFSQLYSPIQDLQFHPETFSSMLVATQNESLVVCNGWLRWWESCNSFLGGGQLLFLSWVINFFQDKKKRRRRRRKNERNLKFNTMVDSTFLDGSVGEDEIFFLVS